MSNRRTTRVPGRYERPAHLRAPLGDTLGEAGVRDGFRAALAANARRGSAGRVATVENATATAEQIELHEAAGSIREAKAGAPGGTYVVDIIRSGWNTSGSRYYPPEVLERDVPKVYPRGTQMYADHPSADERVSRPERSVTTLAAVFIDDPWPVREDDGGVTMRTTVRVFSPWQPLIAEVWKHIGVSINGSGRGDYGDRAGQTGTIMEELSYGQSVDFVTKPGAGGRIVGLLESASAAAASPTGQTVITREASSLGAYVESRIHLGFTQLADDLYGEGRLTRPERLTLSGAIGDALAIFVGRIEVDAPQLYTRGRWAEPPAGEDTSEAARQVRTQEATAEESRQRIQQALQDMYAGDDGRYCWYRDHDPDRGLVWFDAAVRDGEDEQTPVRHSTWQQSYTLRPSGEVTLVGARLEVRPRTVYDPIRPAGQQQPADPDRQAAVTETDSGGRAPSGHSTGTAPDITTRETEMGAEQTPEVVAREAAEARVATVEAARDTAIRERDAARAELARYRAGDVARPILDRLLTESSLPPAAQARVRAEFGAAVLPLTESGALDEGKLRTLVEASVTAETAYLASLAEADGAGRVTGMGAAPSGTGGPGMPTSFGTATREADAVDPAITEALVAQYQRRGLNETAARLAAAGRR